MRPAILILFCAVLALAIPVGAAPEDELWRVGDTAGNFTKIRTIFNQPEAQALPKDAEYLRIGSLEHGQTFIELKRRTDGRVFLTTYIRSYNSTAPIPSRPITEELSHDSGVELWALAQNLPQRIEEDKAFEAKERAMGASYMAARSCQWTSIIAAELVDHRGAQLYGEAVCEFGAIDKLTERLLQQTVAGLPDCDIHARILRGGGVEDRIAVCLLMSGRTREAAEIINSWSCCGYPRPQLTWFIAHALERMDADSVLTGPAGVAAKGPRQATSIWKRWLVSRDTDLSDDIDVQYESIEGTSPDRGVLRARLIQMESCCDRYVSARRVASSEMIWRKRDGQWRIVEWKVGAFEDVPLLHRDLTERRARN